MLRVRIDIRVQLHAQSLSHVRRFWYSFLCCQKRIDKKLISGGPREFFPWQVGNESEGVWNVYFGLMTITESIWPLPSSSVAELAGSISPTPSIRNL